MKKQLICIVMLIMATMVYAQNKNWNEKTRDAAYEAPNSKLQKKWYENDEDKTTYQFGANGVVTMTMQTKMENFDARVVITVTGKYTRNNDRLNITWTGVQVKPNQTDMNAMSARNRDELLEALKAVGPYFASNYKNKTEYKLILRLDDECLVITYYHPQSKMFDDINWHTLYNESHMKREEGRAAQRAAEQARQDSIRKVEEKEAKAKREAEEQARREAEEKAKREAEEKARREEAARIKAENEYWERMGAEKKAAADKAAAEGVKLVDLGLSVRWADRNIGATNPKDDGTDFRWGEVTPSGYFDKYKPVMKPKKGAVLDAKSDPATVKWGIGFHVPTPEQWKELFEKCTFMVDEQNKTFIVTGPNGNQIIFPYGMSSVSCWTNTMSTEKKEAYYSCIILHQNTREIKKYVLECETTFLYTVRAVME